MLLSVAAEDLYESDPQELRMRISSLGYSFSDKLRQVYDCMVSTPTLQNSNGQSLGNENLKNVAYGSSWITVDSMQAIAHSTGNHSYFNRMRNFSF